MEAARNAQVVPGRRRARPRLRAATRPKPVGTADGKALKYKKRYFAFYLTNHGKRAKGLSRVQGQKTRRAKTPREHVYCNARKRNDPACFFANGTLRRVRQAQPRVQEDRLSVSLNDGPRKSRRLRVSRGLAIVVAVVVALAAAVLIRGLAQDADCGDTLNADGSAGWTCNTPANVLMAVTAAVIIALAAVAVLAIIRRTRRRSR